MSKWANLSSERSLLGSLVKNPNKVFEIELIDHTHFSNRITSSMFSAIKSIAEKSKEQEIGAIDPAVLEQRVREISPKVSEKYDKKIKGIIESIYHSPDMGQTSFVENIRIIFTSATKKRLDTKLDEIRDKIDEYTEADELIQYFEEEAFEFSNQLVKTDDIENIFDGITDWVCKVVQRAKKGKVETGVSTGFDLYDKAIGGGLGRGTINVVAARSKVGKSFLAMTWAKYIASQGTPVLYLDTELDIERQRRRLLSSLSEVPLDQIKTGEFYKNKEYAERVKQALYIIDRDKAENIFGKSTDTVTSNPFVRAPFDYMVIKGTSIQEQISAIRRWMARRVGRDEEGSYKRAVIILDYLKLMRPDDRGYATKEYEELGYRMTLLHDLMSQYGSSMVAFAQQNRSGLEREDETTISGSDRIIWLCDSFSILADKADYELDALYEMIAEAEQSGQDFEDLCNMKLIVKATRDGPGTRGGKYIGLYGDIKDRLFEEKACGIIREIRMEHPVEDK